MSIVITAMTSTAIAVVSDSRMVGTVPSERFPKIYTYAKDLAMYGVGNAGLINGYFQSLHHIKTKEQRKLNFQAAVLIARDWKSFVEMRPELRGVLE